MGRNIQGEYPGDWKAIAQRVKDEAGWRCVRCGHRAESPKARVDCDPRCDLSRHPDWKRVVVAKKGRIEIVSYERAGHAKQRVLTVAHLDDNKSNCEWWNLAALCQVCHLKTQGKIEMSRPWVMMPHSAWFHPYVAGFYAFKYRGSRLSREQVESRMEELLALERDALGMETAR